jgi:hypothetical protein
MKIIRAGWASRGQVRTTPPEGEEDGGMERFANAAFSFEVADTAAAAALTPLHH